MGLNIAEYLLDDVYDLYVAALGGTAAWWLGHLTVIGILAGIIWVAANWSDVAEGLNLSKMKIWSWLVFVGMTIGQTMIYMDQFGFPALGAFITALGASGFVWWSWYSLEPRKA
jgi:hypothetical protein